MIPHNEQQDPLEPDVRQIVRASGNESMSTEDKEALWQRIEGDMEEPVRRHIWWRVAAAAAVLIAAGWWIMQQQHPKQKGVLAFAQQQKNITDTITETRLVLGDNKAVTLKGESAALAYNKQQVEANGEQIDQEAAAYNTLIVPYGRRARITLDDGTEVWLNAGSRMVYPVAFKGKEREVFLEGEAYFEVAQRAGQPFFVYTGHLKTSVLGTAFNICAYNDDAEKSVVLTAGSVKVKAGEAEQQLVPGFKAGYNVSGGNITKAQVNTQLYTAWKDGHLILEHEPLPQILKKLSRYFNIRITSAATVQSTFSGDLDLSEDVDYVLQSISIGTGLTYEKTAGGITLKKP